MSKKSKKPQQGDRLNPPPPPRPKKGAGTEALQLENVASKSMSQK